MKSDTTCPCGSGRPYSRCCGPIIEGTASPETAEALMRSRYTAYVLGREAYLRDTWHPTTRKSNLRLDHSVRWLGLKIVSTRGGNPTDREGWVEFVARYKIGGHAHRLHEVSRFVRRDGLWFYVSGELDVPGPKLRLDG